MLFFAILGLCLIFVSICLIYFVSKGPKCKIEDSRFEGATAFYLEKKGDYEKFNGNFDDFPAEIQGKLSTCDRFAIFYDDPDENNNPEQCRYVVGFLIQIEDTDLLAYAQSVVSVDSKYRLKDLPTCPVAKIELKYKDSSTVEFAGKTAYSKLIDYAFDNIFENPEELIGVMEIYHMTKGSQCKMIEVMIPYSAKADSFMLTQAPAPKKLVNEKKINAKKVDEICKSVFFYVDESESDNAQEDVQEENEEEVIKEETEEEEECNESDNDEGGDDEDENGDDDKADGDEKERDKQVAEEDKPSEDLNEQHEEVEEQ